MVKADGYGHGALETALHLADYCGADAFAVATVDEGVALRKALNQNSAGIAASGVGGGGVASTAGSTANANATASVTLSALFQPPQSVDIGSQVNGECDTSSIGSFPLSAPTPTPTPILVSPFPVPMKKLLKKKQMRSPNIRILVLGPPTNLPGDFSLYQQFNLELMCSGPQMARSLMEWVVDCDARRILQVENAATYQKSLLMEQSSEEEESDKLAKHKQVRQASTLSNVEGAELGKELRAILLKKESLERAERAGSSSANTRSSTISNNGGSAHGENTSSAFTAPKSGVVSIAASGSAQAGAPGTVAFKGIEDAAKTSRAREMAAAKIVAHTTGEGDDNDDDDEDDLEENNENHDVDDQTQSVRNENDDDDTVVVANVSSATVANAAALASATIKKGAAPAAALRKIRWHALVDSGMGRLGFKSVEDEDEDDGEDVALEKLPAPLVDHAKKIAKWKVGPHRDTVSIIKAMSDADIYGGVPIGESLLCAS